MLQATLLDVALQYNWTPAFILMVVLSMLLVEGFRIMGRASDKRVQRTPFDFRHYASQFVNWFGVVLSFVSSLVLLAIRDGLIGTVGLTVADPATFGTFYAFGAGAFGQSMIKLAMKAFLGAFGAFGTPEENDRRG